MLIRTTTAPLLVMRDKGTCTGCGKTRQVNGRTGFIRKHYRTIDALGPHGRAALCPGSGQAPAKAAP
jgi:hypothetical protein